MTATTKYIAKCNYHVAASTIFNHFLWRWRVVAIVVAATIKSVDKWLQLQQSKCNSCTKCRCDKQPNNVVAANVHGVLTATTWQVQLHVYCNRHAITGPSVPIRTYLPTFQVLIALQQEHPAQTKGVGAFVDSWLFEN